MAIRVSAWGGVRRGRAALAPRRTRRSLSAAQLPTDLRLRYETLAAHADATGLEHDHQAAFVAWGDLMATGELPELAWGFAVGNGGLRHPVVAAAMQIEGVRAGVPDWLLLVPRHAGYGLAIEFKAPRESLSGVKERQRGWLRALAGAGYAAHVAFGYRAGQAIAWRYLRGREPEPPMTVEHAAGLCLWRIRETSAPRLRPVTKPGESEATAP